MQNKPLAIAAGFGHLEAAYARSVPDMREQHTLVPYRVSQYRAYDMAVLDIAYVNTEDTLASAPEEAVCLLAQYRTWRSGIRYGSTGHGVAVYAMAVLHIAEQARARARERGTEREREREGHTHTHTERERERERERAIRARVQTDPQHAQRIKAQLEPLAPDNRPPRPVWYVHIRL
eukprot:784473-Rhodomonas_salina.1